MSRRCRKSRLIASLQNLYTVTGNKFTAAVGNKWNMVHSNQPMKHLQQNRVLKLQQNNRRLYQTEATSVFVFNDCHDYIIRRSTAYRY